MCGAKDKLNVVVFLKDGHMNRRIAMLLVCLITAAPLFSAADTNAAEYVGPDRPFYRYGRMWLG